MSLRPSGASRVMKTPKGSKVRLGSAVVNASDIRGLRYAWRNRQLVLFLGAGVSMPYGLPSWKSLVLELLFEQAQGTRRLGNRWPHYRRAVASWMTDYFDYNPLVLARMVERDLRLKTPEKLDRVNPSFDELDLFLERLRTYLYANYREPAKKTILAAIAGLIAKVIADAESIRLHSTLMTCEAELRSRKVTVKPVTNGERQQGHGLRVIHPHGYIPRAGPICRQDIVFTKPETLVISLRYRLFLQSSYARRVPWQSPPISIYSMASGCGSITFSL